MISRRAVGTRMNSAIAINARIFSSIISSVFYFAITRDLQWLQLHTRNYLEEKVVYLVILVVTELTCAYVHIDAPLPTDDYQSILSLPPFFLII